jgi:hypothetical protein
MAEALCKIVRSLADEGSNLVPAIHVLVPWLPVLEAATQLCPYLLVGGGGEGGRVKSGGGAAPPPPPPARGPGVEVVVVW